MTAAARFSHLGVCVVDLERSVRFYTDGLGFALAERHEIGSEFAPLMELEAVALTSQMLRRDDVVLELLCYAAPETIGPATPRPLNQLGLTHLSFRVDDVDEVAGRLEHLGGRVLAPTRTAFGEGERRLDFVYLTDPDGVRIELMRLPS